MLGRTIGFSAGGSTGSALHAIRELSPTLDKSDVVLFISPDSGLRYISKFFSDDWMRKHCFRLENEVPTHVKPTT